MAVKVRPLHDRLIIERIEDRDQRMCLIPSWLVRLT